MVLIILLGAGGIAGALAAQIMKNDGYGLVSDIAIGVLGGLIGGWLFGVLGIAAGGVAGAIVAAIIGAIYLTSILRAFRAASYTARATG